MALLRKGTWDGGIWASVHDDYPSVPAAFAPGEVLLDVGCHTGAVCALGARRGATVVGYEANRENYALAVINLAQYPSVTVHPLAVWRSDLHESAPLLFTPHADSANTGGGSVLYGSSGDHWAAVPGEAHAPAPPDMVLSTHGVHTVGLDQILATLGRVRLLKIDVEGAEFPILLTARRLDLVDAICGEYHELTDAQMDALVPTARVGHERYRGDLLRRRLEAAAFRVELRPYRDGLGHFTAERRDRRPAPVSRPTSGR